MHCSGHSLSSSQHATGSSTAQHSSAEQRSAVHTAPGSKHGELGAAVLQLAPQAGSVYRRGKGCGHTAQGNGLVSEQQGGE